jgi:cytochrome c oxidase subunit 3
MSSGHGHGDGAHAHPPYLQHHFDTPLQQFDSGKLGMWLFLATEILLFGGLFCAYGIYRAMHPEIFMYAHTYLDTKLGAINTVILLISSLTMAWGVRAAQLGQRTLLVVLLGLTLLGGFGFLGIKYVEYKSKWEHGLLWARSYAPTHHDEAASHDAESAPAATAPTAAAAPATPLPGTPGAGDPSAAAAFRPERSSLPPPAPPPAGLAPPGAADGHATTATPANVQVFFSIYFLMTGLHGLHVIIGMGAIGWILWRASRGAFSPEYFTPVDLVGLYWHLVDLIWIFLFPLLYLIH